jgi:NAD+ synthase (glutamine-hydrolysing)
MKTQSSAETRQRARDLSKAIGSYHVDTDIDDIFNGHLSALYKTTKFTPKFKTHGGGREESLALQNVQARSRMVHIYFYAQVLTLIRERPGAGGLLVLGSGNVDESLRGYLTKYDCSSADLNPIGSVSKVDLRKFLAWAKDVYDLPVLEQFLDATPTAELEPITETYVQSDEADMGITYAHLSILGRLRKESKLGPYSMFRKLVDEWSEEMPIEDIATLVKNFHHWYQINRHKQRTLTPAVHLEQYSVEDHRHDLRQLLYPPFYTSMAARAIDKYIEELKEHDTFKGKPEEDDLD